MLFAQTVDIKEDVNNYIAQLLRPLRISPSSTESLEDIIEWDQDLIAAIIDSIQSQHRLRDTFFTPDSAPAATILSSQQQRGAMASDKPAGTGMMSAAKDWFLTSKVLDKRPILDDG